MKADYLDYGYGISCIETGYQRPGLAACYLIESDGRAALVDTGTWHTVDRVMAVLDDKGIAPEQVDYVMPTHVHLDHAGGAGELMRRLPNAQLVVHPRGARHMIDPTKLRAGVIAVYGEEAFARDYVELVPVAAERIVEIHDGQELMLGSRRLLLMDTPGHARHHYCVWDEASGGIFSGDTFGLSYREFDVEGEPFVVATTTPVQFDPQAWHGSLDRMMGLEPRWMYLTHYGRVGSVSRLCADLRSMIDRFAEIALSADAAGVSGEVRKALVASGVREAMLAALERHGCTLARERVDRILDMDVELNAQGLCVWLDRRHGA